MTHLMARGGLPGALRPLPDALHRSADRACPAGRRAPSNESLSALLGIRSQHADWGRRG